MGRLIRFLAAQRRPAAATLVQRSRRVMQKARRAVFPDSCVLCGHEAAGRYFCSACLRDLPRIPFACERCGQPVTIPVPPATGCADCITHPPPFRVVRAALLYDFPVDSALKALKFNGRLYYAPAFASLMMVELDRHFQHVDALVPVPLHRWRHATRGFNQAFELCRPLAEKAACLSCAGRGVYVVHARKRASMPRRAGKTCARPLRWTANCTAVTRSLSMM
jgi:predicted amidophosphoribosyltransferase